MFLWCAVLWDRVNLISLPLPSSSCGLLVPAVVVTSHFTGIIQLTNPAQTYPAKSGYFLQSQWSESGHARGRRGLCYREQNLLCLSSLNIMPILKAITSFAWRFLMGWVLASYLKLPVSYVLGLLYSLYFEIWLLIYNCVAFQRFVLYSKVSIVVLAFSRTISIIIPLLKIISSNKLMPNVIYILEIKNALLYLQLTFIH